MLILVGLNWKLTLLIVFSRFYFCIPLTLRN